MWFIDAWMICECILFKLPNISTIVLFDKNEARHFNITGCTFDAAITAYPQ